jgi:hypothetical protein
MIQVHTADFDWEKFTGKLHSRTTEVRHLVSPYIILQQNVANTDIHPDTAQFGPMPLICASYQLLSCLLLASYDKTGSYCI